jgi:hypothetical protein
MQPNIHLNWLAIVVSIVANFALGSLWYGPLFGKAWMKEIGMSADKKPTRAEIVRAMGLNIFGTLLMAYVLAWNVAGWRPSAWNAGEDGSPAAYGFFAAFFSWLGFVVPVMLNSVAFERRSWKLFGIGAGWQLIGLVVMGMILAYWR